MKKTNYCLLMYVLCITASIIILISARVFIDYQRTLIRTLNKVLLTQNIVNIFPVQELIIHLSGAIFFCGFGFLWSLFAVLLYAKKYLDHPRGKK